MRLIAFLIFTFPLVLAAQTFTVEGVVMDGSTGQPMEFATVSLLTTDDELVTGMVTDMEGTFQMKADAGSYKLRIQFVTFQSKELAVTLGAATPRVSLGKITMEPAQKELAEVVVQGERTQMEMNLDKKVYNVGKDLSNLGGSASDLLGNLPSVAVDVDGNVQLRGSSNVRVLIDGKPSGLVGLSSSDALRQLPSNLIERVEIVTNPSARYDAEGQAGIINIILKKDRKNGFNGSFQANTGAPHNHGLSFNVNYRKNWVNLFVNYGVNYNGAPGRGYSFQRFTDGDSVYFSDIRRNHTRRDLSNSIRFGSDFYLNEKTTITTAFLYRDGNGLNSARLSFLDRNNQNNQTFYTRREDEEREEDNNLEYSVNFTRNFVREGHKLTADVQYQQNFEIEQSDITQFEGETQLSALPELFQKIRNEEGEERIMIQSDYVRPFAEKGTIEAGYRSTMRYVKNIYKADETDDPSGTYVPVEGFNTDFAYNEFVHAFYGIVSNEFKKISWQTGLRTETTNINTRFQETGANRTWNYTNFFPSAFFTYKFNPENQLQLSYSRRINRPRFRELNPVSSFTDNRNFRLGNPELQPEFTDSYEVGYLQGMESSSIYYGVYYRNTTQLIQRVQFNTGPNDTETRPFNIGESHAIGAEINASKDFTKWYRITGNLNFYRNQITGNVGDSVSLAATAVTFSTRMSNNFKIPNLFDAQLNINYRAPENQPQGRSLSFTVVDLGLSRDIWNKNGTISVSGRDLFNSRKWRNITELPTLYSESEWQWRVGPQVVVTLNYRLNQSKQQGQRGEGGDEGGMGDF